MRIKDIEVLPADTKAVKDIRKTIRDIFQDIKPNPSPWDDGRSESATRFPRVADRRRMTSAESAVEGRRPRKRRQEGDLERPKRRS